MKKNIATIILFGAIWGFAEATLGGFLHIWRIPFTGTIMASIGLAILCAASSAGLSKSQIFSVGAVAALFKFADPLLFGISPFADIVINPAVAIAAQGFSFALIASSITSHSALKETATRLLGTQVLAMVIFNIVSVYAFGWTTTHIQNAAYAVFVKLPLAVVFSMVLIKTIVALAGKIKFETSFAFKTVCSAILMAATIFMRIRLS